MTYIKRIVKGTAIVLFVNILSFGLGYLLRLLLARNLTVSEFGLFYSVLAFVSLFVMFRSLGFDLTLTKYVSEFKSKKDEASLKSIIFMVFLVEFALSLLIAAVLIIFSGILSKNYFKMADSFWLIILLSLSFPLSVLINIFSSTFLGLQKMLFYSLIEFLRNFFVIIATIVLFAIGVGVLSPGIGYLIAPVLITIIGLIYYRKSIFHFMNFKKVFNLNILKSALSFSMPVFLASIGSLVISYTDTVVLTYFKSMSDVGIYNVALPTANVLLFFSLSLGFAIFPVISEMHALKLHNDIKKAIGFFYNNIFFLTLPFFIAAFVFSKTIITLLFGINYLDSYLPFQILVIGVFFYSLANINITFLNGTNKPIISTKIIFICACINLVLNILLVPFLGVVGAATSTSFCFFLIFLLSYIYLRKNISFDFSWIMLFKSIFVAVLYFVSLFSLDYFFGAGILKEGIILLMCTLVYFVLGKLLNLENVGGFYSLFFKNKKLQKK